MLINNHITIEFGEKNFCKAAKLDEMVEPAREKFRDHHWIVLVAWHNKFVNERFGGTKVK